MKHISPGFPQRYIKALRMHLDQGTARPEAAGEAARQALAAGMTTLELAVSKLQLTSEIMARPLPRAFRLGKTMKRRG